MAPPDKDLNLNTGLLSRIAEESKLMKIILVYSAINKQANHPAPNSIFKPLTNSDSASPKSKGVRFLSANTLNNQANATGKHNKSLGVALSTLEFSVKAPINQQTKSKINAAETS